MSSSKGQSAIEYLMTYGWMLLVVAIVGGAVFSIVQEQNVKNVNGFTAKDVQVSDFGVTEYGNLQLVIQNSNSESIEIKNVNITSQENKFTEWKGSKDIGVSNEDTLSIYGVNGESSQSMDISITYNTESLTNQQVDGTITGNLGLEKSSMTTLASEPEDTQTILNNMVGDGSDSNPYQITNIYELQSINEDLEANYTIEKDLNALGTESWNDGRGFTPIGNSANFTGELEGNNHIIEGIHIDQIKSDGVGIFNQTKTSGIANLQIVDSHVRGNSSVGVLVAFNDGNITNASAEGDLGFTGKAGGGLVGTHEEGLITNSNSEVNVIGGSWAGGLVGNNIENGTIKQSYATASVEGEDNVGGLIGLRWTDTNLTNTHATGNIRGNNNVGGLIGFTYWSPPIKRSYATGNVEGDYRVGGLIGDQRDPQTYYSYATGAVTGIGTVGGLVGFNRGNGDIYESFSTGNVNAEEDQVGGIAGRSNWRSEVKDSYSTGDISSNGDQVGGLIGRFGGRAVNRSFSTGEVSGNNSVGGLIGSSGSTVVNSYWDVPSSKVNVSSAGTGLGKLSDEAPAVEMIGSAADSNMAGLDFGTVWSTIEGEYPVVNSITQSTQIEARK